MKSSYKAALSGVIGAMGIVLMLLTSVVPFGTFAFPLFAGTLLVIIVIELGSGWALVVYVVTGIMSLLLVADKEAALYYVAFLGFYPILKGFIERIRLKFVQYLIKYAVFNACFTAAFYLSIFVFNIPRESFSIFGIYLPWVFLILSNMVFIVYDYFVSKVVTVYLIKYHNLLKNKTKL